MFGPKCWKCEHYETDLCDECSRQTMPDRGCTCFQVAPCSWCESSRYERALDEVLKKRAEEDGFIKACVYAYLWEEVGKLRMDKKQLTEIIDKERGIHGKDGILIQELNDTISGYKEFIDSLKRDSARFSLMDI